MRWSGCSRTGRTGVASLVVLFLVCLLTAHARAWFFFLPYYRSLSSLSSSSYNFTARVQVNSFASVIFRGPFALVFDR
jgi:hypothetical protein